MKKLALLTILSLLLSGLSAQINKYGTPIIKNYSTQVAKCGEYNWGITKDKFGIVYFGSSTGVVRYDGSTWTNIPVRNKPEVRTLGTDKDGIIYVGGDSEFGYIESGIKGEPKYVSLSQRFDSTMNKTDTEPENKNVSSDKAINEALIGQISSLIVKDSSVYFLSSRSLFIYNINSDSLIYVNLRKIGFYQSIRIFDIEDRIILANNIKGLYEYKNGKLEMLPGGDFFAMKRCLTILPVSKGKVLVGTLDKGIFLYDYHNGIIDENWVDKSLKHMTSLIYCGAKISSGEFALGTFGSGILILNNNGKLVGLWNKETTELPDNVIANLYVDPNNNGELWISTFEFISKAYTNIPMTKFGSLAAESILVYGTSRGLAGINSSVNGFCELDGSIYISTDDGVLKSQVDSTGCRYFEKIKGIEEQCLSICPVNIGNESFILVAGSFTGLLQIKKTGKVINVQEALKMKGEDNVFIPISFFLQSKLNQNLIYIGDGRGRLGIIEYRNGTWIHKRRISKLNGYIFGGLENENGDLFVLADFPNKLYIVKLNDTIATEYGPEKGLPDGTKFNSLEYIMKNVLLSTDKGILKYNQSSDSWTQFDDITGGYSHGKNVSNIFEDPENDLWVEIFEDSFQTILFSHKENELTPYKGPLLLLPNVGISDIKSIDNRIWLAKSKNLFVVDKKKLIEYKSETQTFLSKILIGGDSAIINGSSFKELKNGKRIRGSSFSGNGIPKIKHSLNSITFYWTSPYFIEEELTKYSYKLEGYSTSWSSWQQILYKDYTNISSGKYKFMVKGMNSQGIESIDPATFDFIVKPPFYLTWWFILVSIGILVVIITAFIQTQNLVRDKKVLEKKVMERTAEISQKNLELENKNRDITSSIVYAERIQRAILPRKELLDSLLNDHFILFKPRDIVSGDFYWGSKIENISIIAAVDCTGHGVPGAFMSILGAAFLNEIINKEYITHPGVILRRLRKEVIHSLQQRGQYGEQKDGMDISLCAIDYENMKLQFAGANNPLYLIRSAKSKRLDIEKQLVEGDFILYEIKGSKMPISIYDGMDNFTIHELDILKGDAIYLFSDGFADQFGGTDGKKLQYKNFKKIILRHCSEPMNDQMQLIGKEFEDWKGKNDQIDDDLLIGFRIP